MVQVLNGKGFEYSCLIALEQALATGQQTNIITSPALLTAQLAYQSSIESRQQSFDLAAKAAVRVLLRLEPQLLNPMNNIPLFLTIQNDNTGQNGDVRDVLALRRQNQWEIGLSAKHNHSAIKHSRLSQTIDFGLEWLGVPASTAYFKSITPYFAELILLTQSGASWKKVSNKRQRFYVPILTAFMEELKRLHQNHPDIPSRLLSYLLGRKDFYKIIANESSQTTEIQVFSMNGSLNRPSGKANPQVRIPKLRMPTTFYNINFRPNSDTTVFINCDEGWNISARIHNASTFVEPSLKFDIQLIGVPPTLYRHVESWD